MRIAITGLGLVTPLGHSAWSNWRALLDGRTICDRRAAAPEGIDPVDLVRAIGSVSIAQHTADDPAVELAERAARQALSEAGAEGNAMPTIVAASKGAVHDAARTLPLGPVSYLGDRLAARLGVRPIRHVVAACASSLLALHLARRLLVNATGRETVGDRLLVVTAEAALRPIFVHSYRRLGVLPPLDPAGYVARPLDLARCGFALCEVGAAMVLERRPADATDAGPPPLAWLGRTAVAAEAHDAVRTPTDRSTLRRVAERMLREPIDLLHPHATGTVENDASELDVYCRLLTPGKCAGGHGGSAGTSLPDVYAVKGALGHGLGSSGLTSAIVATAAAVTQRRPPMPWLERPIASALPLCAESPAAVGARPIRRQAVFAAGFGGHVAGAVIETARRRAPGRAAE